MLASITLFVTVALTLVVIFTLMAIPVAILAWFETQPRLFTER